MAPDAGVAEDVAELWAAATYTENGSPYNDIFAYSTLPKGQCWIYGNTGILAFIMEISDHCWWSGADVDTVGQRVSRGSMVLVDRVLNGPGLSGRVVDSLTGSPLQAEVQIAEMHQDGIGPRLTEASRGTYHRLTGVGSFTMTVSCRGYLSQTRSVSVGAGAWTVEDFALVPNVSGVAPNGRDESLVLDHALGSGETVSLRIPAAWPPARAELFDVRGRRLALLGRDLYPGDHELSLPRGLAGGVYLLRIGAGRFAATERLVVVP